MNSLRYFFALLLLLAVAPGCGGEPDPGDDPGDDPVDDDDDDDDDDGDLYAFESDFEAGASSVSYSGQTFRHLLISDLTSYLAGLTEEVDGSVDAILAADVLADIEFYFAFDSVSAGDVELGSAGEGVMQATYDDVSSGKDLVGKLAGNDPATDHKDWSTELDGWSGATSPEGLVRDWFAEVADQAEDRANGVVPLDPDGVAIASVNVTEDGRDLRQLVQKFLLGALTFSQGADDYLDDDVEGKGLLADNVDPAGDGKPYTALEHAWDEGFGYFGAARDYVLYTDDQIADGDSLDTNEDALVDLLTEKNFGHSINAAKRDRGSNEAAATDFTADAWQGFYGGRALIAQAEGALTEDEMTQLQDFRDQAVQAWENAIAATVVHYINDTLADTASFGTDDYSFANHAKHWSELKGFALSFQFNPRSPLSEADFVAFHDLVGDAPVLPSADQAEIDAYVQDLVAARSLLQGAYGFDEANMGDDQGQDGW